MNCPTFISRISQRAGCFVSGALITFVVLHYTALVFGPGYGDGKTTSLGPTEPLDGSEGLTQHDFDTSASGHLACHDLPGAGDVVVVMKTGSTEFQDKFPVHVSTTLRCYNNLLVFSDHEEIFEGIHVIDALESIDSMTRDEHPGFELWRRLRHGGRSALLPEELSGSASATHVSKWGKTDNSGWKLDKWRFLPMLNRTYHEFPAHRWYLFVETDTYIFWQTLLNYLQVLDSSKPYYVGSMILKGDVGFAHGGMPDCWDADAWST